MEQTWRANLRALSEESGASGSSVSDDTLEGPQLRQGLPIEAKASDQSPTPDSKAQVEQRTSGSDMATRHSQNAVGGSLRMSVCIITYNRSRYLRNTLRAFFDTAYFAFPYEILICDNSSTDDTPEVVAEFMADHPQIRYVRQTRNVGAEANYLAALHLARGEYVVYLADDDELLVGGLAQVLDYMDCNPDVGVCHSPWELWDKVAAQSHGTFYRLDSPRVFAAAESLELCDFILDHHVFPEVCVYRADVMRRMMYLPRSAFYAFVHLINVLDYAKVAFLPVVFYRSITVHWPGDDRQQNGNSQTMTAWDSYRGGLELMIHHAYRLQGLDGVPEQQAAGVAQVVDQFVYERMKVALRLLVASNDLIAAHAVMVRLLVTRTLDAKDIVELRESVAMRAAVQAMLQIYDAATVLDRIGTFKVSDARALRTYISGLRPELSLIDLDQDFAGEVGKDRMLVLAGSEEDRDALVGAGYPAGHIKSEQDLYRLFAS